MDSRQDAELSLGTNFPFRELVRHGHQINQRYLVQPETTRPKNRSLHQGGHLASLAATRLDLLDADAEAPSLAVLLVLTATLRLVRDLAAFLMLLGDRPDHLDYPPGDAGSCAT